MEIVYLSCDNDEHEYNDYTDSMPWKALPFKDPTINALATKYGVSGIPSLIIINKAGQTIRPNARGDVQTKGVAAFEAWKKAA